MKITKTSSEPLSPENAKNTYTVELSADEVFQAMMQYVEKAKVVTDATAEGLQDRKDFPSGFLFQVVKAEGVANDL